MNKGLISFKEMFTILEGLSKIKGVEKQAKRVTKDLKATQNKVIKLVGKLSKSGTMALLNDKTGFMKCYKCGAEHYAQIKAGTGKYFRKSWHCPNGCKP